MNIQQILERSLADVYSVERELGGGGMSRVFLVEERKLGRTVVLKAFAPDIAGSISVERFTREIRVSARLQHPHIVPLLTAGDAGGVPYYTMPYIRGETLRQRMAREGKISVDDAIAIAREVADALGYAHAQGIVHRDIKPENILLSGGHAMVVDFGIAKALNASKTGGDAGLTQVGFSVGTPAYMSPEQAAGESVIDGRSDVYSLGAVLYEMLTGNRPFTGASAAAIIAERFKGPPAGLRTHDSTIPSAVDAAVVRAMAISPADRFGSAAEFLAALSEPRGLAAYVPEPEPAGTSIAVLPFANLGGNADDEYFSDGMTEEIINALGQLPGLRVAARTSSFAFKGTAVGIGEIGARLRVGHVLEGTVRRAGKRLRINVQLISVADGYNTWSGRFDREFEDVFEIQEGIARAIADELKVKVAGGAAAPIVKPPTANLEAYDLYLRGRYFWERRGSHLLTAVDYFTRATKADPDFALPYAGLADADAALTVYGYVSPVTAYERARVTAYKALQLDASLAESHQAVGLYELWMGLDLAAAERAFSRAIEIKPAWGVPHVYLAQLHAIFGRDADARRFAKAACDAEPLSPLIHAIASIQYAWVRAGDEALRHAERAIELEPAFPVAYWAAGWAYQVAAREADATRALERGVALSGNGPFFRRLLATQYALIGREGDARAIETDLGASDACVGAQGVTAWALGDEDRALALLTRAAQQHDAGFCIFARAPRMDTLEADPRWHALLRIVGQPDVATAYERRTRQQRVDG